MLLTFSPPSSQRMPYQQFCIKLTTIDNLGFVKFTFGGCNCLSIINKIQCASCGKVILSSIYHGLCFTVWKGLGYTSHGLHAHL